MADAKAPPRRAVAQNRKAFHDYAIEEKIEAGIVLAGTEVKSLRDGRANLSDAYAGEMQGELYLFNAYIPAYRQASHFNHETRRPRKLLVHRKERNKLFGAVQRDGYTLVPLQIYFNPRGMAKVEIGLGKGKKTYDKRASIKDRDWQRQKERLFRKDQKTE